jgi:anti-sigma factor RsiW
MSEQIREQVSAFLDGELPDSETELLLKRLTRDGELRESFGRYALIGEALRGTGAQVLTRGFAARVNLTIDGEPAVPQTPVARAAGRHWWRPFAGVAVAAGVATVAIVALQQRAIHGGGAKSIAGAGRRRPSREAFLYRARELGCIRGHRAGPIDQLRFCPQQVLVRLGAARCAGGPSH